jgi:hypothetical protein
MFTTPEELEAVFERYFEHQDAAGRPYTVAGLCLAAGFSSRQSLYDYAGKVGFVDAIEKARLRIEEHLNERLLLGQGAVVGAIFALKNTFPNDWRDRHEREVKVMAGAPMSGLPGMPPAPKSLEELESWYREMNSRRVDVHRTSPAVIDVLPE